MLTVALRVRYCLELQNMAVRENGLQCFWKHFFELPPAASQTPKHYRGLVDSNSVAVLAPFELPLPIPAEPGKNVEFSSVSQFFRTFYQDRVAEEITIVQ